MPRISRLEIPKYPYHVIQRGNRSQKVFLKPGDKEIYLAILKLQCQLYDLEVWAYCLMDNHVHLIVLPKERGALTECISEVHRQYSRMINFRQNWRGHLWQGRFKSFPMDDNYLLTAVRYVERNPVRAGLVERAEDFRYSSARAHVLRQRNDLLSEFYLTRKIADWRKYLAEAEDEEKLDNMRMSEQTGRPLGEAGFVAELEEQTGRILVKQKPVPRIRVTVGVP